MLETFLGVVLACSGPEAIPPPSTKAEIRPSDRFKAQMILSSPIGAQEKLHDSEFKAIATALRELAIELEIMDPRDSSFTDPQQFIPDLDYLKTTRVELADAPLLLYADKLPRSAMALRLKEFNVLYRNNLEKRIPWERDREWLIRTCIDEARELWAVWDNIHDAGNVHVYVNHRRRCLKRVMEYVGRDAFYRGELPDFVPTWRFCPLPR